MNCNALPTGLVAVFLLWLSAAGSALAEPTALLPPFVGGTPALAAEVNANFDTLAAKLPANVVVVSPTVGDDLASGTDLLTALAGIIDASAAKPYLLKLAPGVYDLGTLTLTMKPFVDIEGSGEGHVYFNGAFVAEGGSIIRSNPSGGIVLKAAANTELRFLLVEAVGAGAAIQVDGSVTSADPFKVTHVTAFVSGTTRTIGYCLSIGEASPIVRDFLCYAYGGSSESRGIHIGAAANASAILRNVAIFAAFAPVNKGINILGVGGNASADLSGVEIQASGGFSGVAYGIYNSSASTVALTNVTIRATGPNGCFPVAVCNAGFGIYNAGTAGTVTIHRSTINGNGDSINNFSAYTVNAAASQLTGPVDNFGGGTFNCVSVYDGSFAPYTCP